MHHSPAITQSSKKGKSVTGKAGGKKGAKASRGPWTGTARHGKISWTIHCGDAREKLKLIKEATIGCTVTSPPYFWQRDYRVRGQLGLESAIDDYVQALCDTMDEVKRVLRKDGTLFLNLGDTYYSGKGRPQGKDKKHAGRRMSRLRAVDASGLGVPPKTLIGIPWRVALEMISRGWILRSTIIWTRKNVLPEANVRDRPWRTYELVFLFVKSRHYSFARKALQAREVEDIWTIESNNRNGKDHPATFPEALVERCLEIGNHRRRTVLDPFVGSGTVIKSALKGRMSAIGIDLSAKYCRRAAQTIATIK